MWLSYVKSHEKILFNDTHIIPFEQWKWVLWWHHPIHHVSAKCTATSSQKCPYSYLQIQCPIFSIIFEVGAVITSPDSSPLSKMHCHIKSEMPICISWNSVPDISYHFLSGRCNNIAWFTTSQLNTLPHQVRNDHICIPQFSARYLLSFLKCAL